jgi:hypothetical protein
LESTAPQAISSLEEAIAYLEFELTEDNRFTYDAGHTERFEANEYFARRELQALEHFAKTLGDDEESQRLAVEYQTYSEALGFILEAILARPGYIPLAERPETHHQRHWRERNIENLDEALGELESIEVSPGTFMFNGDGEPFPISEEYVLRRLADLNSNPIDNDDHINFYPFHNRRFWIQSYEIVLAEIRKHQ